MVGDSENLSEQEVLEYRLNNTRLYQGFARTISLLFVHGDYFTLLHTLVEL